MTGWMSYAAKDGDGQASKNLAQLKEILGADLTKGGERANEIREGIAKKAQETPAGAKIFHEAD